MLAPRFLVLLSMILLTGCSSCSAPRHYRNATWEMEDGRLHFRGDETCARKPLPYNTTVDFVQFGKKWGFIWKGVYHDPGAINRTLTTSVLYLAAADEDLNPVTTRPLRVAVFEDEQKRSLDFFLFPTLHGVSVIYTVRDREARCVLLNLKTQKPMLMPGNCHFNGQILKNGGSESDWALDHWLAYTYVLMVDRGLVLMRSADPEKQEEVARVPGTGGITSPVAADLLTLNHGTTVVWAQPDGACSGVPAPVDQPTECRPYRFATLDPDAKTWVSGVLPVTGRPVNLHVQLFADARGLFALLQLETRVVRQDFDPKTKQPAAVTELVDLSQHTKAVEADFFCLESECWIGFPGDQHGSFLFSTRTGLHRRDSLNYRIRCGAADCLEDSEFGVKKLRLP